MISTSNRRKFAKQIAGFLTAVSVLGFSSATLAADEAADAFIKRLSDDVMASIKNDKAIQGGDLNKLNALVDSKIMPHVNFKRMTASAVGPAWLKATPDQQKQLQDEFKILLLRIYAGALTEINDKTISYKPLRANPDDMEVVVRSEVRGKGEPIQLDYRLEKTPGVGAGWRIYNLNVMGVWLMETYRSQFSQQINASGVDGLITSLKSTNQKLAKK
ncbi:MAG TPA: ABC transporter substrate-binding protein [Burkholderiaceae bacterium]|nr:ABC transporter substrate-binding protein [Burkholderiaceae bacterium]